MEALPSEAHSPKKQCVLPTKTKENLPMALTVIQRLPIDNSLKDHHSIILFNVKYPQATHQLRTLQHRMAIQGLWPDQTNAANILVRWVKNPLGKDTGTFCKKKKRILGRTFILIISVRPIQMKAVLPQACNSLRIEPSKGAKFCAYSVYLVSKSDAQVIQERVCPGKWKGLL